MGNCQSAQSAVIQEPDAQDTPPSDVISRSDTVCSTTETVCMNTSEVRNAVVSVNEFADTFAVTYLGILPDAQEQADAMKSFASGKMTYAQMRELCG